MSSATGELLAPTSAVTPRAATRLLISVRSIDEALAAVDGGADFIDLKEPRDGALGGLPLGTIREIVEALRRRGIALPISATIGDLTMREVARIVSQVEAVAACGVDVVKVGIERDAAAAAVIDALAQGGCAVVPVFIADRGLADALVARACTARSTPSPSGRRAFPAMMVDTADKHSGSLFEVLSAPALQRFIATVRASDAMVGVAGALQATQLDRIATLNPDFAGFRSAVCVGDRGSRLDATRVRALSATLRAAGRQPVSA